MKTFFLYAICLLFSCSITGMDCFGLVDCLGCCHKKKNKVCPVGLKGSLSGRHGAAFEIFREIPEKDLKELSFQQNDIKWAKDNKLQIKLAVDRYLEDGWFTESSKVGWGSPPDVIEVASSICELISNHAKKFFEYEDLSYSELAKMFIKQGYSSSIIKRSEKIVLEIDKEVRSLISDWENFENKEARVDVIYRFARRITIELMKDHEDQSDKEEWVRNAARFFLEKGL